MTKTILAAAFGPLTPLTHLSRCMFSSLGRMHIFIVGSMHNFVHGHIFRHNIMIITNSSVTFCKKKYHYYTGIFFIMQKNRCSRGTTPPPSSQVCIHPCKGETRRYIFTNRNIKQIRQKNNFENIQENCFEIGQKSNFENIQENYFEIGQKSNFENI